VEVVTIFVQTVTPSVDFHDAHPAVTLIQNLCWIPLCKILDTFGSHQFVSESVAKCFKNIIYSYRIHSLPLLGPMAEKLVWCFEKYEYGCFLWVSGAIVRQFGLEKTDGETQYAIWQFVERQCVNTFRLLELHKPNEIPDRKN
jgi:transportin-3